MIFDGEEEEEVKNSGMLFAIKSVPSRGTGATPKSTKIYVADGSAAWADQCEHSRCSVVAVVNYNQAAHICLICL